jgi:hypothetical protein
MSTVDDSLAGLRPYERAAFEPFTPDAPIPDAAVEALVRARPRELDAG